MTIPGSTGNDHGSDPLGILKVFIARFLTGGVLTRTRGVAARQAMEPGRAAPSQPGRPILLLSMADSDLGHRKARFPVPLARQAGTLVTRRTSLRLVIIQD